MLVANEDQWTRLVRPTLAAIRSHSSWVNHHSKEILDKVNRLPYAPGFETEAQAEIDGAIVMAEAACVLLRKAKEVYANKPRG